MLLKIGAERLKKFWRNQNRYSSSFMVVVEMTKAKSEKTYTHTQYIKNADYWFEQGKKEAFLLMQKALGNCYCGKYAKCPVVEKIKRLSK
jgi:hypothetical protein